MEKNLNFDEGIFYLCYLIENIGRRYKVKRNTVVRKLGYRALKHIYDLQDVYHCLEVEQVVQELEEELHISFKEDNVDSYTVFNNVDSCDYYVPKVSEVANTNTFVICRLLRKWECRDCIEVLIRFYNSRVYDRLEDYNTDLFAESPEYLTACFLADDILQ